MFAAISGTCDPADATTASAPAFFAESRGHFVDLYPLVIRQVICHSVHNWVALQARMELNDLNAGVANETRTRHPKLACTFMTTNEKDPAAGTITEAIAYLTERGEHLPVAAPFDDGPGVLSSLKEHPLNTAKISDFTHLALQYPVSPKRRR